MYWKTCTCSANAMEPDILVQMVVDVENKGIEINEIEGDDDTTRFERLNKMPLVIDDQNH